jgi:hypothetical protein
MGPVNWPRPIVLREMTEELEALTTGQLLGPVNGGTGLRQYLDPVIPYSVWIAFHSAAPCGPSGAVIRGFLHQSSCLAR